MSLTISASALRATVERVLLANGSSAGEAATVAHNLVLANLSGHDSHGVGMLPRYVDAVLEGGLTPNTSAKVVLDTGSLLTIDGGHGFGQVIGEQAMALGMERAQQARQLHHDRQERPPPRAHRPLQRDGGGQGPGVHPFRQRDGPPHRRALGRRRRPLRHQPLLHRHSAQGPAALRARLRHQPRGPGQDARGAQRRPQRSRPAT